MGKNHIDNWITAEELINQLQADPEYQKRMAEKETRRNKSIEACREADKPVLEDLHKAGYRVDSIADYLNSGYILSIKEVEILIKSLPEFKDRHTQEIMVRALGHTKYPFDGKTLAVLFEISSNNFWGDSVQWVIANTISIGKLTNITDWVVETIKNKKYGFSREMLCYAVAKMLPVAEAIPLLISIFDQLPIHATDALGKIAMDKSVIEYLRKKQKEYSEILEQKKYRSTLHRNRLKSTVRGINSAIRKVEKRIAVEKDKTQGLTKMQKPSRIKAEKRANRFSMFFRRKKYRIKLVEAPRITT